MEIRVPGAICIMSSAFVGSLFARLAALTGRRKIRYFAVAWRKSKTRGAKRAIGKKSPPAPGEWRTQASQAMEWLAAAAVCYERLLKRPFRFSEHDRQDDGALDDLRVVAGDVHQDHHADQRVQHSAEAAGQNAGDLAGACARVDVDEINLRAAVQATVG